ncbi:uncharacterized protein LOC130654723 [Hydractinia symbiolongicarpus]|uniref:uncharacterized protein LOC130654723 n=1 Tax=Hydractinia symbiolongicarpus TaxID=13093 RepID=UPI00254B6C50|nr:uncharacterized protein LOC130654723 [Hydractinia symbiolongicarpus]
MNILVFLLTWTILATGETATLSRDTLNDLVKLIGEYKSLDATGNSKDEGESFAVKKGTFSQLKCSESSRITFKECIVVSSTVDDKRACAKKFVDTYKECFFGKSVPHASSNGVGCQDTCIRKFDKCLYTSNKVEEFVCINGRDTCRGNCKIESLSKRGCSEDCDAGYRICEQHCEIFTDILICQQNEKECRKKC